MIISLLSKLLKTQCKFCNSYSLRSLCLKSVCYKNPEKPSYIGLFQTNSSRSFHSNNRDGYSTQAIETGLSDSHELIVTILKMYLPNNEPKFNIHMQRLKSFNNSPFSEELLSEIMKL